jgi:hypothetical protein
MVPAALPTNKSALVPRNARSLGLPSRATNAIGPSPIATVAARRSVLVLVVVLYPRLRERQTVFVPPLGNQVEIVVGSVQ